MHCRPERRSRSFTDSIDERDLQKLLRIFSKNPSMMNDLLDGADVKDMIKHFQRNPKKAMKV